MIIQVRLKMAEQFTGGGDAYAKRAGRGGNPRRRSSLRLDTRRAPRGQEYTKAHARALDLLYGEVRDDDTR